MADKEYVLDGIKFLSESEYRDAKKEYEGIRYIMQKNDMSDGQVVLSLYNRFVQKRVFRTPIGHRFLKEMQEKLLRSPDIDKSQVLKLPVYELGEDARENGNTAKAEQTTKAAAAVKTENAGSRSSEGRSGEGKSSPDRSSPDRSSRNKSVRSASDASARRSVQRTAFEERQADRRKLSVREEKLRNKYKFSVFLNWVLVLMIAAMAYITLKSDHVNILNYEIKLLDKYSVWADELQLKESRLTEWENELKAKSGQ